jgi:hypothetical protein
VSTPTAAEVVLAGATGATHTAARLTAQIHDLTTQRDAALETATAAAKHAVATAPMTPVALLTGLAVPWMVATRWDCPDRGIFDRAESVGVLIGPRHVLTVAHLADTTLPVPPEIEKDPKFVPFAERERFVRVDAFGSGGGERYEIVEVKTAGFDPHASVGPAGRMNDIAVAILDRPVSQTPIRRATTPAVVGEDVVLLGITPLVSDARQLVDVHTCVIDRAAGSVLLAEDEFCAANTTGALQVGSGFSGGALYRTAGPDQTPELLGICSRGAPIAEGINPPIVVVDTVGAHARFLTEALQP